MKKRRLFDKDVEIARQNTGILTSQAEYLSDLAIYATLYVTLLVIFVQAILDFARTANYNLIGVPLSFALAIGAAILIVPTFGFFLRRDRQYTRDLRKRVGYFDDIPNAVAAHAKWILYPHEKDDKDKDDRDDKDRYFFVTANGRVIEEFDREGRPRFRKN